MKKLVVCALFLSAVAGVARVPAAQPAESLPLPEAPVLLLIADPGAFDQALTGGIRRALAGSTASGDPVATAWRQTRVGGKLESQWALFSKDLPLSWKEIASLKPSAVGLSLLSVADLEAVLAIRTPLAELPLKLPSGTSKTHRGIPYHLASRGAGDERTSGRRMGLATSRVKGILLIATSERSLLLALDRSLAGEGPTGFLPGLASMKLELPSLRKDPYFRHEFLFDEGASGAETGTILTALRREGEGWVEVREGESRTPGRAAPRWNVSDRAIAAAGWEPDGARFWKALRRGFLEPVPLPSERPVAGRRPLPDPNAADLDRNLVDITRPVSETGGEPGEGELPRWAGFLTRSPVEGWGWEIGKNGARRLVLKLPPGSDAAFAETVRATVTRRAGNAQEQDVSGTHELHVGPDLATFAWRRRGEWIWIGLREEDLAEVPEPHFETGVVRWGRLDLDSVRALKRSWAAAEGSYSPDRARPFSDRILGLLGWIPGTSTIGSERIQTGTHWTERVVFASAGGAPASNSRK